MNEHWFGLQIAATLVLTGAIFWYTPNWSRPEIFFSVTVPASFRERPEARRILARFRWQVVIITFTSAMLAVLLSEIAPFHPLANTGVVLLAVFGLLGAQLLARRATRPFAVAPTLVRQAVLREHRDAQPVAAWSQVLPFGILATSAAYLASRWNSLPETIVIHWNASFEPDGWMEKSLLSVFGILLVGFVVCLGVGLMTHGMQRWSRRVNVEGEGARVELERRGAIVRFMVIVQLYVAILFALVGLVPLAQTSASAKLAVSGIVALSLAGSLVMGILSVVTMARYANFKFRKSEAATVGPPIGDRTPDACWKLGIFYYNPEDAALFVERRFGFGYDLNFARPAAWALLGAMLVVPLLVALLIVSGG